MTRITLIFLCCLFLLGGAGAAQAASISINENNYLVYQPDPGDRSSQVAVAKDPATGKLILDPYFDSHSDWFDYLRAEYRWPKAFETAYGDPARNLSPVNLEDAPFCEPLEKQNLIGQNGQFVWGPKVFTVFACPAEVTGIKIRLAQGSAENRANFHSYLPEGAPSVEVIAPGGYTDFGIFAGNETYIEARGVSRALVGGLDPFATFLSGSDFDKEKRPNKGYTSITADGSRLQLLAQTGQTEVISDTRRNDVFLDGGSNRFISNNPLSFSRVRLIDGQNRLDLQRGKSQVIRYPSLGSFINSSSHSSGGSRSWLSPTKRLHLTLPGDAGSRTRFVGSNTVWLGNGTALVAPQAKASSSKLFRKAGAKKIRAVFASKMKLKVICTAKGSKVAWTKRWRTIRWHKTSWGRQGKTFRHQHQISRSC